MDEQRPAPAEGGLFKRTWFAAKQPLHDPGGRFAFIEQQSLQCVRAWDLAWTEAENGKDPDGTVGVLLGKSRHDTFYVLDVVRARLSPGQIEDSIAGIAALDGSRCRIRIPQDPGAGKFVAHLLAKKLIAEGYTATTEIEHASKAQRAAPVAAALEHRIMVLCEGPWNEDFIEGLCAFPHGSNDDQVDAVCAAYRALVRTRTFVGVDVAM